MTGSELTTLRESLSLSAAELGELLGIHRSTVQRIERKPTVDRVVELAVLKIAGERQRLPDPNAVRGEGEAAAETGLSEGANTLTGASQVAA